MIDRRNEEIFIQPHQVIGVEKGERVMEIKKMKKMNKIVGTIGSLFNRNAICIIATITNSQSDAINYLYEVVCEQNEEIEEIKKQFEKFKEMPEA